MLVSAEKLVENAKKFHLNDEVTACLLEYHKEADENLMEEVWTASTFPEEKILSRLGEAKTQLFLLYQTVANRGRMEKLYEEKGYSSAMLEDASQDLALWVDKNQWDYGRIGLGIRAWCWQKAIQMGRVLQFGRLQCEIRHEYKGNMCVVERDGKKVFIPVEEKKAGEKVFFAPGDAAINIHIPASGPLRMEACQESFRKIAAFSAEYQKEYPWKGFMFYSWILDPFFADFLPTGNLAQLQKLGPLYDLKIDQHDEVLWRVFHLTAEKCRDLKDHTLLPRNTTMERAVADHLLRGGTFSEYAMVVLREE